MEMFPGRTAIYKGARVKCKWHLQRCQSKYEIGRTTIYKGARAKSIQFG